jgi:biotin carboxyl carrier protein
MKAETLMIRGTLALLVLAGLAAAAVAAPRLVEVRATLTGEVLEEGLARPGQSVRDGDPLVYVRTLVGRAVAARAPADGTVAEVLVRPGQVIREKGAVVARLLPR